MQNEPALVALQAIDVIVYQSGHKDLSPDDIKGLRSACSSLLQSVQGNDDISNKAASLVSLIHTEFLGSSPQTGIHRDEILKGGISLSIYIHRMADSNPGARERSAG